MSASNGSLPIALVIEDDPTIKLILNRTLEQKFKTVSFNNALDALGYLHDGNLPDIIISDLNTPNMGGLELIGQLRASGFFSAIPVLVLSGEESTEMRIKCLDSGADDYVVKPFNPRELVSRLNAILRRVGKLEFN